MGYHSEDNGYNARITRLEIAVAELQGQLAGLRTRATPDVAVKEQAAAQQATQHLYAPLRSDVRALTELSAFVRKVANLGTRWQKDHAFDTGNELYALQQEAESILRGLTA